MGRKTRLPQSSFLKTVKLAYSNCIPEKEDVREREIGMNEKLRLSGVPETMLQTLYARALQCRLCVNGAYPRKAHTHNDLC